MLTHMKVHWVFQAAEKLLEGEPDGHLAVRRAGIGGETLGGAPCVWGGGGV